MSLFRRLLTEQDEQRDVEWQMKTETPVADFAEQTGHAFLRVSRERLKGKSRALDPIVPYSERGMQNLLDRVLYFCIFENTKLWSFNLHFQKRHWQKPSA